MRCMLNNDVVLSQINELMYMYYEYHKPKNSKLSWSEYVVATNLPHKATGNI